MKFALLKELKTTGDARVLFSPKQLAVVIENYPQHQFIVQCSSTRAFSNQEYTDYGIFVTENILDADVFLGIKEVPLEALIPNKTYFFFSHTSKMQPHNKGYLQGLKNAQITFYDYENFTNNTGKRLISFGNNAGIIGAYQAIRTYGLKNKLFTLPSPSLSNSFNELLGHAKNISFPPIKIITTGTGNVGKGISEFLKLIGIDQISSNNFLTNRYSKAVFTQLSKKDYLIHKTTESYNESEFISNPSNYKSTFLKFAQKATLFIAGHYHHIGMPLFFSKEQIKHPDFKINTIGDVSCDVNTPLPTCLRPSTTNDPIYGYHKFCGSESNYINKNSIAVMAIDNLPGELPRETSIDFGNQFITHLLETLLTDMEHPLITQACVLKKGEFTDKYRYLDSFLNEEKTIEQL